MYEVWTYELIFDNVGALCTSHLDHVIRMIRLLICLTEFYAKLSLRL